MGIEIWGCISVGFFMNYKSEFCKDRVYYGEFLDKDNIIKAGIIICLD